jgi:beta-glucosidase-like glycosyl hydrolase
MTIDEKVACLGTNTRVQRLGVPNIGSSEGIHGVVQRNPRGAQQPITTTQFPQPPGMGESWDPDLVRQAASVEGYEARSITQTAKYGRQLLVLWGPQAASLATRDGAGAKRCMGKIRSSTGHGKRVCQRTSGRTSPCSAGPVGRTSRDAIGD